MKHHERTRIIIEMESFNGELGDIDIGVRCWDGCKATKISRAEILFIISSIFNKILNSIQGGLK